ncbi:MAG: GNAT family N-acetyltransferase [Chlorobium sp.]
MVSEFSEIRAAVPEDIPRCAELLEILFNQENEFIPDSEAQSRGLFLVIHNPELGRIFVCVVDGIIQGMVMLLFTVSTFLGEKVALLEDMVVAPEWRGHGAGSLLIDYALEFAREDGVKRITLLTDRDNELAQQFYRSKGFTKSEMLVFRSSLSSFSDQKGDEMQSERLFVQGRD